MKERGRGKGQKRKTKKDKKRKEDKQKRYERNGYWTFAQSNGFVST